MDRWMEEGALHIYNKNITSKKKNAIAITTPRHYRHHSSVFVWILVVLLVLGRHGVATVFVVHLLSAAIIHLLLT